MEPSTLAGLIAYFSFVGLIFAILLWRTKREETFEE